MSGPSNVGFNQVGKYLYLFPGAIERACHVPLNFVHLESEERLTQVGRWHR